MNKMSKKEKILEAIEKEQEMLAKKRIEILGMHCHVGHGKTPNYRISGKSGRMKTYKFRPHLNSWNMFMNKEINMDELKVLQRRGM